MFFLGLIVQLVALFHIRTAMWPEEFQSVLLRILGIYSAQLGVVLGSIFAQPKHRLSNPPAGLAWVALGLVLFWNVLLAWRTIAFSIAEQDSPADLMKYLDSIAASSSFLVAGSLSFFFGRSTHAHSSTS